MSQLAAVGAAVGVAVGASVAPTFVGAAVGASVGAVGVAVGAAVGVDVGVSVGAFVGASDGLAVGVAVGFTIGEAVSAPSKRLITALFGAPVTMVWPPFMDPVVPAVLLLLLQVKSEYVLPVPVSWIVLPEVEASHPELPQIPISVELMPLAGPSVAMNVPP